MMKKISGIILLLVIILTATYVQAEQDKPLADSVLRLHVVANSDTIADQELKLEVKNEIVAMMQEEFRNIDNAGEARDKAIKLTPQIQDVAESAIKARGYEYPVKVNIGEYDFPTKSYGNLVFPGGEYQAVRIIIGAGEGKNWWCVLFPPLCMVSSSDKGLSLDSPGEAQISFKCLELIPKGAKFSFRGK